MASEAHESAVAKDLMLHGASVKKNSIMPAKVKRSAEPRKMYCKATQRNVIGRGLVVSNKPNFAAVFFLLVSTKAATAIATMERNRPVPILCRCVIPISVLVTFLANGTMMWL